MQTVLLLGAGTSAASKFALPTMRGFFTESSLASFPELRDFLTWFFATGTLVDWNLEEVMAYLDLQRVREGVWLDEPPTPGAEGLYRQLLSYVTGRLSTDESHCELHVQLFRFLGPRDSIITINYDLVADRALEQIDPRDPRHGGLPEYSRLAKVSGLLGHLDLLVGPPPSLLDRERQQGFYLKLHGSLDWLYCPTAGCYNNANIFHSGGSLPAIRLGQGPGLPCRVCGSTLRMFIVPPVARKHIDDRGRLAFLWNLAWRELIDADRIVIVGMSLPPTDFELRWLLRSACAMRKRSARPLLELQVVNPNQAHCEAAIAILSGAVSTPVRYASLEEFLASRGSA